MLPIIEITDEDIHYAESILLPIGKVFDDERREFIRNLSTIDLQAVPGSGKTTALLAKLLILETKIPLHNGSGVLVLSHTNAAIDEVKERIQRYCPKLFRYPNFIGTIQSFVNEFLAIPYYTELYKKKPNRVDDEFYNEYITKCLDSLWHYRFNFNNELMRKVQYIKNSNKDIFYKYRIELKNGPTLTQEVNSQILEINKPRGRTKFANYNDYTTEEKSELYNWFYAFKKSILNDGYLNFDDAYFFANLSINKRPSIIKILQKRFRYVFIDEMQDMDTHQYELTEKIFFNNNQSDTSIQRIGDKNQSIYNSVKIDSIWQDRDVVLRLSNSQRLSRPIANIVKNFALYPEYCTDIQGLNECQLKPHIILFSNTSIRNVIPYFSQLVLHYKNSGELTILPNKSLKIKVISWNTDWKDDLISRNNPQKVRLEDYHQAFKKNEQKPKEDYKCLKSYIYFYDKNTSSLASIRKNIIHALLKILRIENKPADDNRPYTIQKLMNFLKRGSKINYEQFNLKIYQCALKIVQNEKNQALDDLKSYIPIFISYFIDNHTLTSKCSDFINNDETGIPLSTQSKYSASNIIQENNLRIEITSVHSVKGQTHDATLYLESCFHEHESKYLAQQFLGYKIEDNASVRIKQAQKMAYVGFSRATQLLCIAIHKDRFNQHIGSIDGNVWEVTEVLESL